MKERENGSKSFLNSLFGKKTADTRMLNSLKKTKKKAEKKIKKLSPELKKIAQLYLDEGYGPVVSLREAMCFLELKKQEPEIQKQVERLVERHKFYTTSLRFAKEN